MSYNTIQRMLSNRRYIGELRLRDVVQPNAIPALVSEDLFNKVQEKLAKKKRPLPVIRQRKAICLPPSCTAVSAER